MLCNRHVSRSAVDQLAFACKTIELLQTNRLRCREPQLQQKNNCALDVSSSLCVCRKATVERAIK